MRENPDTNETRELLDYPNVERWYNRTMHTEKDVSGILKKYNQEVM